MKLPWKERAVTTVVIIPSTIIVVVLAVLQYRWSVQVSEATAVRLADSLQMSLVNWQKDFFRFFSEVGLAMRIDSLSDSPGDPNQYARRFAEWKAFAKYPALVSNIYLLDSNATQNPRARRLNPVADRFEPADWPVNFLPFRGYLRRAPDSGHDTPVAAPQRGRLDVSDSSAGWLFEPSIPALMHPVGSGADWIAVELNREEIQAKILPDLSHTYFQGTDGLDFQVAVLARSQPGRMLYSSDAGFGDPEPADADGIIDLFGATQNKAPSSPVHVFHAPSNDKGPSAGMKISWFPPLRQWPADSDWRLVVRHRRGGPLGAFVAEMRHRDLAIGFGVLLVLVINMAMLIVTSHRAQRLAQLQMNFVTAVSHELRTPLTVIISGSENICNGIVETRQQMIQYGSVIANQARQLFGLVERILLFAATRQGHQRYNLEPLDVQEIIDAALASLADLIEEGRVAVERHIERDLPQVNGDASALSQCVQNLITNALKYGKEQRWLEIRCEVHPKGPAGAEVWVSVSDRGIGISPADLRHIFEPFYRSSAVRAAQIHGTGLGLFLSKSIAEAMTGRLVVRSDAGHGSTFTLCLPALPRSRAVDAVKPPVSAQV